MSCPIRTMNYQQVHQALDRQFRCLEEKYRRTMEEHLRAIEKKHCLEMKQDQLLKECHSQYKGIQDRSKEDQFLKCQETQEQEQILNDHYQEYRKSQYLAMEEEYKRLKQKQGQVLEKQCRQNRELGDQALKEKYCLYKQLRERCSEEQFKRDLEKLHSIKEGRVVKSRSRPEQLQYRVEIQDPCLLFKGRTQETPCPHRKEPHAQPCWCQRQSGDTETYPPQRAEGHLGYCADDESSCESKGGRGDAAARLRQAYLTSPWPQVSVPCVVRSWCRGGFLSSAQGLQTERYGPARSFVPRFSSAMYSAGGGGGNGAQRSAGGGLGRPRQLDAPLQERARCYCRRCLPRKGEGRGGEDPLLSAYFRRSCSRQDRPGLRRGAPAPFMAWPGG
ncbi:hypothetical protein NDU88_006915 [Pleurodeles waltl]|uniref:Uncharacterized protein n=1 Tax=Pleurodeles waltl TaxID=8319 RepID=A0AAV7LT97_PLEWA|nr:hypothetical protein NDU88_006915 [Pleurodeles waltl]